MLSPVDLNLSRPSAIHVPAMNFNKIKDLAQRLAQDG
jgi:hypothetical protein